ncbi:outer membrane lipoprotein carrier protein LolA [Aestuariirhabdus sp. Z084]|uniref:LolA family protein n=1 Tax=Aestuariirhabdus haliotis TaxID=2918751 RepID=UPI00201B3E2A|nr:outer membrane lipoprotein carrier protein LolA [Aestuariirhabdus haliotis]MCL6414056.1 outer membrane lipoprotein carrier protein LolA [Aestuariirhabdus haliotis]MCL6417989.1 outer membrane lipoprotein carrier protein LolA [Aestuariirhabdus haliotis]
MKAWLLLVSLIAWLLAGSGLVTAESSSQTLIDNRFASLQNYRTLRGEFMQLRTLPNLSNPLRSSGQFILSRDQGFLWQQQAPFRTRLVFSEQRLIQQVADKAPQILTPVQNPAPFYFVAIFQSLLGGDWARLRQDFRIEHTDQGLLLQPIQEPMRRAIEAIRIEGQDQLSRLTMIESSGGRIDIHFKNLSTDQLPLSDAELKQYQP